MAWTDAYINIPHSELDCAELVEKVLAERYGKNLVFPKKESANLFHRAALITRHVRDYAYRIEEPFDGCGVLMKGRGMLAHMGIYVVHEGLGHVLHSDGQFGSSVCVPFYQMVPPLVRVEGFYGWL